MANTIVFTPLPTTAAPSPSQVTYTPTTSGEFLVQAGVHARTTEGVSIDRTDYTYSRDRGRAGRPIVVIGTDTFSSLSAANAQLTKLEQMSGASCVITSTIWGSFSAAICRNINSPVIMRDGYPGYHIDYRLEFVIEST